jgi:AcrR family transcriptional regulator
VQPIPTPSTLPQTRQRRSERTLQRILDAFERELEDKTFEEITVVEICSGADCSIGSFYGRVGTKDGLLEHLRVRVYGEAERALALVFDPARFGGTPLGPMLAVHVRTLVQMHARRRGVIRALMVQARRRAEFARHTIAFNDAIADRIRRAWLARADEVRHEDPELAVEHAVMLAAGYLRESIVFGSFWPGRRGTDVESHTRELTRTLVAYLTGKAPDRAALDRLVAQAAISTPFAPQEDD